MLKIQNNRIRGLTLPLLAVALTPAAMARISSGAEGAVDPSNDATSLQQYGVTGAPTNGGSIPPGIAAPLLGNRPNPAPVNPMPRVPSGPNGGPFGNGAEEGPMHAPPGIAPNTTPVPLPSPFGLGVTGLLAATAIRRRRAR